MKTKMIFALILLSAVPAFAGRESGGGDLCENRIQIIRDNIQNWIKNGGPNQPGKQLKLPNNVSLQEYSQKMSRYLGTTKLLSGLLVEATDIECVHNPITLQEHEKVCRFDKLETGPKITCYYEAFLDKKTMSEDGQYQLVHHEYAGLAGLEEPNKAQSTYPISDQISSYLQNEVMRRLPVGPPVFEVAYQDLENKIVWSKFLPEEYPNCLYDENGWQCESLKSPKGVIDENNSAAAKACSAISGRLPTKAEIDNLIREFGHTEENSDQTTYPRLTLDGLVSLQDYFGILNSFWSATELDPENDGNLSASAYSMSGVVRWYVDRRFSHYVICVRSEKTFSGGQK